MIARINILLIILLIPASGLAQGDGPSRPDPPVMDYVSVDTATGYVYVTWKPSPSDSLDRYIIYEWREFGEDSAGYVVGAVGKDTLEYLHATLEAGEKALSITVASSREGWKPSPMAAIHTTIFLSTHYDSCDKKMELSWTPYLGWGDDLVRYDVYYNVNRGSYIKLTEIDPDSTAAYHLDIMDNRMYCYFIKAIRNDDMVSFSNIACRNVSHPLHPAWINAESASAMGTDQVEVKFSMDPAGEVTSYQLFKAAGPGKPFMPDEIFTDITEDSLTYLDPVVSTEKKYRYKLYSLDVCNNPFTESNICGNIVLTARSVGLEGFLSWNPYLEYEAGVKNYLIYRDINRRGPVLIMGVPPSDTTYKDDLSFVSGEDIEDEICYLVEAEENDSYTRGNQGFSRSNLACVSVVPEILMANAFTPNDDGVNEEIKPELTFIPRQYIFQVFDRWGSRIFETRDPNTPWKGRVNGGPKAPEGVYVYYIKLTTSSGIEVEKKGVITVIYP